MPRTLPLPARLAAEIDRVVRTLRQDAEWIVTYYTAWRTKDPLLDALATTWADLSTAELLTLTPAQILAVDTFHDRLAGIRLWAENTDAMPLALGEKLEDALARLERAAAPAIDALGGLPNIPRATTPRVAPSWWGTFQR